MTAADTFAALYRLQALRRVAERAFADIDAMVLPTAPTAYSTAQVLANPIELNSRLGTYTNFVNLLDLCGLALPAAMRPDDIPFGITLLAPAGRDAQLASIGRVFHADTKLPIGAQCLPQPPLAALPAGAGGDEIAIAVVGAHLSGMALNGELKALGGRLLEEAVTAPDYKLYALDTTPPKPGMLRVEPGAGSSIKLELWALSAAAVRKIRRRDPAAAVDRHHPARRRPRREGLYRRARRDQRRTRHFIVRRLARVRGGEGGGVSRHHSRRSAKRVRLRMRTEVDA